MLGTSTVRPGLIGNPKRNLPTPKWCILQKCWEIAKYSTKGAQVTQGVYREFAVLA